MDRLMNAETTTLLGEIVYPENLRKLPVEQLPGVCDELRDFIIETVSTNGGHFGASLGVVELTVALHYVFNTPYDQLVWDVGHQAYGHKILTGRKSVFNTNRQYKGISGFPKRSESEYDTFGVGHSSTSISAALGMALASLYKGEKDRQHIAVIGDGAMTGGMAFEAMNHAGVTNANLLIILNDNCMSIDPNVGALKEYLTDIAVSKTYNKLRNSTKEILDRLAAHHITAGNILYRAKNTMKHLVMTSGNLFEALKLRYFGPLDGHNVTKLADTLQHLKSIPGPKLLHIVTTKGKGYPLAEQQQTCWHAPGLFNKLTGEIYNKPVTAPQPPKYQDVFGHTLIELAEKNDAIFGITPAMPSGSSLNMMMEKMPHRALDVGICEQHAVTLSAGLATQGMRVFCNIYSTFMQRGYDQLIHDVVLQHLPVVFCLDRGGLVGEDGPTHHGAYDIAYTRCLPDIIVSAPMNEEELRNLMYTAQLPSTRLPFVIRYPRGQGVMTDWRKPFRRIEIGTGRIIREGKELAILSYGHPGNFAIEACEQLAREGLHPAHVDIRFVKPLDEKLLHKILQRYNKIITVEDGTIKGGFGSAVLEFMAAHRYAASLTMLGIPDVIAGQGKPEELIRECGFDAAGIAATVKRLMNPEKMIA